MVGDRSTWFIRYIVLLVHLRHHTYCGLNEDAKRTSWKRLMSTFASIITPSSRTKSAANLCIKLIQACDKIISRQVSIAWNRGASTNYYAYHECRRGGKKFWCWRTMFRLCERTHKGSRTVVTWGRRSTEIISCTDLKIRVLSFPAAMCKNLSIFFIRSMTLRRVRGCVTFALIYEAVVHRRRSLCTCVWNTMHLYFSHMIGLFGHINIWFLDRTFDSSVRWKVHDSFATSGGLIFGWEVRAWVLDIILTGTSCVTSISTV